MKRIKLFCFPYAGGSAVVYQKWKEGLDPVIDLRPIELAGRGQRMPDPFYKDVPAAIDDVLKLVKADLFEGPYAFFGHSLGCMIAYRLAERIREEGLPAPIHLFFSGRLPPNVESADRRMYHLMPEEEFKREVVGLGGTPPELFEHPDLEKLFLPVLQNDFRLSESDPPDVFVDPMDCPITVFLGKQDGLTAVGSEGWREHSKELCTIHYFRGGHFFWQEHLAEIIGQINFSLKRTPNIPHGATRISHGI